MIAASSATFMSYHETKVMDRLVLKFVVELILIIWLIYSTEASAPPWWDYLSVWMRYLFYWYIFDHRNLYPIDMILFMTIFCPLNSQVHALLFFLHQIAIWLYNKAYQVYTYLHLDLSSARTRPSTILDKTKMD